jgi:single-strand DNA-binding protein
MLNHIVIAGRLTRDPEVRTFGEGAKVASFTVAVDRDYSGKNGGEKKTDFFDCTAWRKDAEFASKYFKKGTMAIVCGPIQFDDWVDKDGNKRRNAKLQVANMYFGESKRSADSAASGYGDTATPASWQAPIAPSDADFALLENDDDQLPF